MKGKVGQIEIEFVRPVTATSGVVGIKVGPEKSVREASYKKDKNGIWISLDDQIFGFDFEGELNDLGEIQYRVLGRNSDLEVVGARWARDGESASAQEGAEGAKKRAIKIKAQMPGKIIQVRVKPGDTVTKGQGLLVMEAMKMENEIKAPSNGTVSSVKAVVGANVETGAELVLLS